MKLVKTMGVMALGMGVYMMYDKYGKKLVNKMNKKMNKAIEQASNKIDELL